jgi:WD40 repeat protein
MEEQLCELTSTYTVTTIVFSHDQLLALASDSENGNTTTKEPIKEIRGHSSYENIVAFLLASALYDKTVILWDPITGEHVPV